MFESGAARRRLAGLALALLAAGAGPAAPGAAQSGKASAAAAAPADSAPPLRRVTLQLKWKHQFQFAGYYAALAQGYYREAGLDVRIAEADGAHDPAEAVLAGRAEFGIGTSELAKLRLQGKPVVVLATIFQHSPLVLVASRASGVRTVHDLPGKRMMLEPGGAEIPAYLKSERVDMAKIRVMEQSFSPDQLMRGEIDAMTAYVCDELYVFQQAGFPYTLLSPRMAGIDFYGDCLFTTEDLVRGEPELVAAFRAASLRGWKHAFADVEGTIDLVLGSWSRRHTRGHLLFEAAEMRRLVLPGLVEIGYGNPGRWRAIAEIHAALFGLDAARVAGLLYDPAADRYERSGRWWMYAGGAVLALALFMAGAVFLYRRRTGRLQRELDGRQRLIAALRASDAKNRALLDGNPDLMFIVGRDGVFREYHAARAETLVAPPEAFLGRRVEEVLSPELADTTRRHLGELLATGSTDPYTYGLTLFGQERFFEARMVPCGEDAAMIIVRDITAARSAERELRQLEIQLRQEQKLSAVGTLANGVAHEINNPLTGVINYAQLIVDRLPADGAGDAIRPYCEEIIKEGDRIAAIVRNLLVFSRQEQAVRSREDLAAVTDAILSLAGKLLAKDDIDLVTRCAPGLPPVSCSSPQIQQVLLNLLTNARDALNERWPGWHGEKRVRITVAPFDDEAGRWVRVTVRDNGGGIPDEARERIFDPFFTTKDRSRGTGLGLSISYGIVREHGGRLTYETWPGEGTEFHLDLPVAG